MPLPLYGFLEGDTIGLLILADESETVASLARKLQQSASIRVQPGDSATLIYQEKQIDPWLTLSEAGFSALERFDVKQQCTHGFSENRGIG